MPHNAFTMDNFFAFMNQAMAAGIFEPSQQKEWIRFVPDIPELLNQPEKEDLRRLEIAGIDERYLNTLHQKSLMASSWLIFQRKKLLTRAVGEFVAFSVNPRRYWADHGTRKPTADIAPKADLAATAPIHRSPVTPDRMTAVSKSEHTATVTSDRPSRALVPTHKQRPAQPRRETGIEYQNRLLKNPSALRNTVQVISDDERRKEPFVSNF